MTLRVVTSDVIIPASSAAARDTTAMATAGRPPRRWSGGWRDRHQLHGLADALEEGQVLDVVPGSALENATGPANLRTYAATDLVGRDGTSN
jgi:hypothetical protein